MRFIAFACVVGIAGAAGCAGAVAPQSPAALVPDARPAAAATPLEYVYIVNYNGNYVGQYGIYPTKPALKPIGPNVSLPCQNPDSLVTIPRKALAIVSCFSGQIAALKIAANHTLTASPIKPLPIPSPLSLIAPHTGAAGVVYATEYQGAVAELRYTATSLKLVKTYATHSTYPNEMAFYSGGSKPELFVAAPYAGTACGSASSGGGILAFTQSRTGALTPAPTIPACGVAYNVVVSGTNLYWAGGNVLGAYSLTKNAPLPSPKPPWPANGGPSYFADAVSDLQAPRNPKAATAESYSGFFVGSNNGNGYVVNGATGGTMDAFTLGTHLAIQAAACQYFALGLMVGGSRYQGLCFAAAQDSVSVWALPEIKPRVRVSLLGTIKGSYPIDIRLAGPCSDYEYYYYYC